MATMSPSVSQSSSALYTPTPVEEAYALYLLRSVFHRDYNSDASTDFVLEGQHAVPFLTLSGQDRLILRNIWTVADPKMQGALTDLSQFHVCLRLVALAQAGILGQALAAAFREQSELSPVDVMRQCLQATATMPNIPLPVFVGIAMPSGTTLQLIYQEHKRNRVMPSGRSLSADSHSRLFASYQSSQVDKQSQQMPPQQQQEDSDRTIHTSNVSFDSPQDDDDHRRSMGGELHDDDFGDFGGFAQNNTTSAVDGSLASQQQQQPPATSMASMSLFGAPLPQASLAQANNDEDDFGDFASTEPSGWDALDALAGVQDAPLPQLMTSIVAEPSEDNVEPEVTSVVVQELGPNFSFDSVPQTPTGGDFDLFDGVFN